MGDIIAVVKTFFESPEFTAFAGAVITFLAANLGTIVVLVWKLIKLRIQDSKSKDTLNLVTEEIERRFSSNVQELMDNVNNKLNSLSKSVNDKLEQQKAVEEAKVEAETFKLQSQLEEIKKNIVDTEDNNEV